MPFSQFPVSEYYKENILDAETISRRGIWWTAILLIRDPRSGKNLLNFYLWQKTENGWRSRKKFTIRNAQQAEHVIRVLEKFKSSLS